MCVIILGPIVAGQRLPNEVRTSFQAHCEPETPTNSCYAQTRNFALALRSLPPFTGVPRGPGLKVPHSAFGVILGTCLGVPQRVLFEWFLGLLGPKNAKKHSKRSLWGTPRQVPKITQKALAGALSGLGAWALL